MIDAGLFESPGCADLARALSGRDVKYLASDLAPSECSEFGDYLLQSGSFPRSPVGSASTVRFKDDGLLVFKVYRISGFRNVWRARSGAAHPEHGLRFADAELHNYRKASGLGLPVPGLRAVIGLRYGLRSAEQLVVLERLDGFVSLTEIVKAGERIEIVLDRVAELVLQLASNGVLHFDLNTNNVMLSECLRVVRLVDLERMRWNRSGASRLAGYYFGYLFRNRLRVSLEQVDYHRFVLKELRKAFSNESEYLDAAEWFERSCATRYSRTEMYRIFM